MFLRDLRHALRVIVKSPALSIVAVFTMAIGIGAATGVFSLINVVLLHSFPYGDVRTLVYLWTPIPKIEGTPHEFSPSVPDFTVWQRETHSYSVMAQFMEQKFKVDTDLVPGAKVTADFFRVLEAAPQLGRVIDATDDQPGRGRVVVISDAMWHARFAGRADVLRQTLDINHEKYAVVGVMPPSFSFPHQSDAQTGIIGIEHADLWIPAAFTEKQKYERGADGGWEDGNVVARLRPGVTPAQARAELSAIEEKLNALYPPDLQGWQSDVEAFAEAASGSVRRPMWLMFGAVCAVLLISCGNVAGLLIARSAARVHEMGVRAALGASRGRLMRQMLTESLLLASAGGAMGIAVAYGVMRLALAWNPGDIPRLEEASLDLRVLGFTVAVTVLSGILFGLGPAFAALRINLVELMKSSGKGVPGSSKRLGNALTVAQMALTVVLLFGAGLLLHSYRKVAALDKGYSPATVTASIGMDEKYQPPGKTMDFTNRLLTAVRALPGVEAAGAVTSLPLSKHFSVTMLDVKGYPEATPQAADSYNITPGYFEAMRIRQIEGRMLDASDITAESRNERNVVVNEAFAKRFFAGRNAIGGLIRPADAPQVPWWHIVGIVADIRHADLESVPRATIYASFNGGLSGDRLFVAARGAGNFRAALPEVIKKLDPEAPVTVNAMDEKIDEANRGRKFQTAILTAFAGSALMLALVGLYGLTAYHVRRRTAEIGIRMAIGATPARILRMVVGQGLLLAATGLAFGLAGSAVASRVIASMLFGVTASDPATLVAVPLLLLAVAAAACALPASRAARVSPSDALRHE